MQIEDEDMSLDRAANDNYIDLINSKYMYGFDTSTKVSHDSTSFHSFAGHDSIV